ncbi:MAG: zinc ribbon domain-containing protein [Chloroflexi bacterium]|nr:zinc ribbon domain-containing protein [Chloroflexota bacterium]
MPLYEYLCDECEAVFELLRPARQAGMTQPCPNCDTDSRPLISREFQAFTLRDGLPRQIPDRGKYWHYKEEVSAPISHSAPHGEHPEVYRKKTAPERPPTAEERDRFQERYTQRLEKEAESLASGGAPVRNSMEEQEAKTFLSRAMKTARQAQLEGRRDPNAKTTPRTRTGKHKKES